MINRNAIALLFSILLPCLASGQYKFALYVKSGIQSTYQHDDLASPYNYHRGNVPAGILLELKGNKTDQWLQLNYLRSTLRSSLFGTLGSESHSASYTALEASYSFLFLLKRFHEGKYEFLAGPSWLSRFNGRDYNYGGGLEDETFFEMFSNLDVDLVLLCSISNQISIRITNSTSLMGLSFRNPYEISNDAIGAEGTFHSIPVAFLHLSSLNFPGTMFYNRVELKGSYSASMHWKIFLSPGLTTFIFHKPVISKTIEPGILFGLGYIFK